MKRTDLSRRYMHRKSTKRPFLRILAHARGLKSGLERNPTCFTGKTRGKPLRAYFCSNLGGTLDGTRWAISGWFPGEGGRPCHYSFVTPWPAAVHQERQTTPAAAAAATPAAGPRWRPWNPGWCSRKFPELSRATWAPG